MALVSNSDQAAFLTEAVKLLKMAQNALEEAEEYLEDVVTDEDARDHIRDAQASTATALRRLGV